MRPWVVAVGASGSQGLRDVLALLAKLPDPLDAVVLIVLHRPWHTESYLRDVLAAQCSHPIVIARTGQEFRIGTVYIGEPSRHLTLTMGGRCELVDDPERRYGNRTVDLLFRSVAVHGRRRAIGVVLSGALDDGSRGLGLIKAARGRTMVLMPKPMQYGMPEHAVAYNVVDAVGNTAEIASAIVLAIRD